MTIEEIAAKTPNAMATGPFGSAISARFFQDAGVPVIRGSNLSEDIGKRLVPDNLVFVSDEKAREFQRSKVVPGDLIFTCWGTIGQVGLIDASAPYPEFIVSNKQMKLTPDPESADSKFLYYLMSGPQVSNQIRGMGIGSSVPGFNLGALKSIMISLPPLPEQRAIAHILGTLDDKIALNRQMNQTLEQIAAALFRSWFIDFEPVRAKMAGREPEGMDAATVALFPERLVDSELGEIPEGWQVKSLDQIATYLNGLAMQKFPPEGDSFLPVIKIAQLRKGDTEGADRASLDVPLAYVVSDGDVLFSWSGSLEVEIWSGGTGALNQHLFKVSSDEFPKWFYFLWTRHHLPRFREYARDKATTMGHIQRRHLTEAKVVVPPQLCLQRLNEVISPVVEKAFCNSITSKTLASTRDLLLPELLSGAIRVS
ncbi:MAG: restriction endonuclease subunit S [Thermomicrobiales bacterium]